MTGRLQKAESVGRRVWPPTALSLLLIITFVVFNGINSSYWTDVGAKLFLTILVVLGLQMFSGNSGVISFGHTAFMAVGAYTSALLTTTEVIKKLSFPTMPHFLKSWIFPTHLTTLEGTLVGGGFAILFALLTAAPISRLAGAAGGIATLGVIVIVDVFINQTPSITNGTETMIGVPSTTTLTSVTIWAVIFVFVAFAFQQSRTGLRLRASRENHPAAQSVGVRANRQRAIAWVASGFVVGVAGALYGHYFTTFSGADFFFNNGLDLVLLTVAMLVVGGMTSVTGAIVGCYVVTIVYTIFNRWVVVGYFGSTIPSGTDNLAVALLLLVVLILRPRGITDGREITWPRDWYTGWVARRRPRDRPLAAMPSDAPGGGQIETPTAASD
jgi:branched-chain amino acid transport system permease protein